MSMPSPIWSMNYSSSRRKSSHRCWCCNKVIKEGEAVLMARVTGKATRCMHEACSEKPYGASAFSGRDYLEAWGMEYLANIGFTAAKTFMSSAPICRPADSNR